MTDPILATLASLRLPSHIVGRQTGPRVVRTILRPHPGIRVGRIVRAAPDLAVALGVDNVHVHASADGVVVDVPRAHPETVLLGPIMDGPGWPDSPVAYAVGRDMAGAPVIVDLARMPHVLIAGATGTGKSVALNALLVSMLRRAGPRDLRLVLIDAKRVELAPYRGLPHLAGPIATETADAERMLRHCLTIMEQRYRILEDAGARQVSELPRRLSRYVVVVDELADLVMVDKSIRDHLVRLAQKSRAAGIHLVLATQRPSADVISGILKANVPARMALAVASNVDSRVILDCAGAEDLLGRGDMLCRWPWTLEPVRVQGAMVTDAEIASAVSAYPAPVVVTSAPQRPVAPSIPAAPAPMWYWAALAVVIILAVVMLAAAVVTREG
jgi:S-DNA-T family DNA segregation ATPase FtsK/SpoIIIE